METMNVARKAYDITLVNGQTGDPAALLTVKKLKQSAIFDLGEIYNLSEKQIRKIEHVFITHTHMDHFSGFDRLIRLKLRNWKEFQIYGPSGIGSQISYRLKSYTWNLLNEDDLHINIYEVEENNIAKHGFLNIGTKLNCVWTNKELALNSVLPFGTLQTAILSHLDIQSIAYSVTLANEALIDSTSLIDSGLEQGPWLSKFKKLFLENKLDQKVDINSQTFSVGELASKIETKIEKNIITYMTDFSFDHKNLSKISLFKGTTHLICESTFHQNDFNRARKKAHLTATQSALIAVSLKTNILTTFHKSAIYASSDLCPLEQSQDIFHELKELSSYELSMKINNEILMTSEGQT